MILVTEHVSGTTTTKPSSVQKDVDIVLASTSPSAGMLSGNTPTNDIQQNNYSTGRDKTISIHNLSMTKVAETTWGSEFVDHIRDAREYFFDSNGYLSIKTVSKTLTFKRM